MKQQTGFILFILLWLITACTSLKAAVEVIMLPAKQPTSADTGNDGLAPPLVPQNQAVKATLLSAAPLPKLVKTAYQDQPLLMASAQQVSSTLSAAQKEQLALATIYYIQAFQYLQEGLFRQALPLNEKAFQIRTEILGEKHPDTLMSLNNLAMIYKNLGSLSEALPLLEKSYRFTKEVLGEKHPSTLRYLNNLAMTYQELGHLSEALPLHEKCYRLRKEVFREKHPYTLTSLNNLAMIYLDLGSLSEALPLLENGYRLTKELLEEKHPDTLTSLSNSAVIYNKLGRLSEALPLYEKAYRLRKEVLGEKHPDTLGSLNNLAVIYNKLGRLSEALPLYEKAYRIKKEVLGEKHPDTLTSLSNLASIYKDLGSLSEALPLLEKGYRLRKAVLGEKHYLTLTSLNNLGLIYLDLGRLSEALPLFEKGYRLRKEVVGEKHPYTLTSLNNLAAIYQDLGSLSEALPLFEKGYRLTKEVLGEKHPDTLDKLNNLAGIYNDLGRLSETLPLFEKGYRLSKEVLGKKHPDTLGRLNNLATIYYPDLGRLSEALPLLEKNYHLRKEVLGEKHPDTFQSLNNLATIYQDLGLSEALPLLEKNYRLIKEALGEKHSLTLTSLNNLAKIYQDSGRAAEALPLFEKGYHLSKEVLGEEHSLTLTSLNNLAKIYQDLGRAAEALPLLEKGYRLKKEVLGEKHPDTLISLHNLHNLAYIYAIQGKTNKAIKHFEKLVTRVEQLRSGDFSAENRQTLFKLWVKGYLSFSRLYISQSRYQDAFRLAEMSKARTLLESLAAKLAAQQSGLTAAEQQQLQDDDARLAFLNNQIAKALANNRVELRITLGTEKNQLVQKGNQFHQQLMAKYPKYAKLSKVQIVDAKQGAQLLPNNAVLISYSFFNNSVFAFTLQANETLTAHDLGTIPNLDKDLDTYRRRLSKLKQPREESAPSLNESRPIRFKKPQTIQSLSRHLSKSLLEPLKEIIKDKPYWIISPDGPLALIPFETLRFEGKAQPVIAQHQISYVQSLSVLTLLQERDRAYSRIDNRGTLLAMGAPIYQDASVNKEGTTTNCSAQVKRNPNPADFKIAHALVHRSNDPQRYLRAFRQLDKMTWCNLPGAERELEQLEELFQETKPRIYKQAEATEANLQLINKQGILAQSRYLVFATHGYMSPKVPAMSSIVLGQVNNPPGIDGYVTAGEWPGYDLKSDLMVLSACETGLGETVSGEGVMGLPYAFYVAGNKNTLLTLWAINDDKTAEFITGFFAKLKAGQGQIEALTATKREFINKGGEYSQPAYWAAFVLYGV